MSESRSIAIIPARGGSKRIPRKNIREFEGQPIIAYSIQAALEAQCFSKILVSTDDAEIAEIAVAFGAAVPFLRSAENSGDFSGLAEVSLEVLQRLELMGERFDLVCCILPTAPFITSRRIKDAESLLHSGVCDAVLPVVQFSYPPQRGLRLLGGRRAEMISEEYYQSRSQDLEPIFHDSGQFYWIKVETLQNEKRFFAENTDCLILSELEVQDIDTEEDWSLAEYKYRCVGKPGLAGEDFTP